MPSFSTRGKAAHSSPIRKLSPFADAAKLAGKKVYHLNIGQPDILTPSAALEKVREMPIDILAYSPSKGNLSYRQKLLTYYTKYHISLGVDDVMVTNGASEALFFCFLACLDAGQNILAPEPFYANYLGFGDLADVRIKPLPTSIENGFALPDIEGFRVACTPDVKAILLCNPNNPTGAVYPEAMLRDLAALAVEKDIFLFVDEVYREFCYGEIPFFSVLNIESAQEHIVVFDSISKRYSACGARIGALLTRNKGVMATALKFAETRLSPPSYGQWLGEALVDTESQYFETVKAEYLTRRNLIFERLQKIHGVECYCPEGAFYVFAKLPIDDGDRFCRWLLSDFSYENQTVMLAPGAGFYASPGRGKQEVRIAYVLNIKDLGLALDCLERGLAVYGESQMGGVKG